MSTIIDRHTGKKLVFVSMTNMMGGAENVLHMLAKTQDSPIIFIKRLKHFTIKTEGNVVKYLTRGPMFIGFLKAIVGLYEFRNDHILFSTHPYLNAWLGLLKRLGYINSSLIVRECSCVFTRYSGVKKLSYQIAYKLGYTAADLVICQTTIMRNQLLHYNKFLDARRVVVQGNPVDLQRIGRKEQGMINEKVADGDFICSAGRLISIKGFHVLIQAFSEIASEYEHLKLLILGTGEEYEKLSQQIRDTRLEDRIFLLGHIENPFPFYARAQACVISSIQEGFPNVLLEMMALNPSVVTTLCAGGIDEIPSVIKCNVNDIKALARAIRIALNRDRELSLEASKAYLKDRTPEAYVGSILDSLN